MSTDKAHLEDRVSFSSSIQNAARYRLAERMSQSSVYPVPRPEFSTFPKGVVEISPRQAEREWYDYILYPKRWEYSYKVTEFNDWLSELQRDRQLYWEWKKDQFDKACHTTLAEWEEAKSQYDAAVAQDRARIEDLQSQYETGGANAVVEYFLAHLNSVPLPVWCPREYELEFDEGEGILLIDVRLPYFGALEVVKTRLLQGVHVTYVPASQKEARELTNQFPFLVALRLVWEVVQIDNRNRVSMVACNGYVIYDDPATGQRRRDVILTVAAKWEDLKNIRLERVEPEACFRSLKGVAAAKISELVPIQPLIRFNKEDSRFITAKEVLDTAGNTNLATMDWQDFEHLIRELFQKEFGEAGLEVKVTQASRDRGVDAVVFDPDPLRGGKFVIQAKRYTDTVDVSAVRDLYGTVVNEGANRGILVTTTNYGRDAYDFAKDKPITLINGANLLHLLSKHGYHMKIDIKEAKRLLKG